MLFTQGKNLKTLQVKTIPHAKLQSLIGIINMSFCYWVQAKNQIILLLTLYIKYSIIHL